MGCIQKQPSLLNRLSKQLNGKIFQDLNWGGWGWEMVCSVSCFFRCLSEKPSHTWLFCENRICRDIYEAAPHLGFFFFSALLTVNAVSRHWKCSKKLLRLYRMSLYNHESQRFESWLLPPEVRSWGLGCLKKTTLDVTKRCNRIIMLQC